MVHLSTGPLRVTSDQWNDIRHHYEDPNDYDDPPRCEVCDAPLDWEEQDFELCQDCIDAEEGIRPEPIPDDHLEATYEEANGDTVESVGWADQWDYEPSVYDGTYSED